MLSYKNKIQILQAEGNLLKNKRRDMQLLMYAAEKNGEIIKPEVLEWLKAVDESMEEVDEFFDAIARDKVNCCYGRCPNPKSQSWISQKASKITGELTNLQEKCTFSKIADPALPVQLLPSKPVDFKGFGSRMLTKTNVLDVLKENNTSVVGIYGVAGVGKTRMIEEIAEKVKVESLFDEVVMVTLAQIPNVKYIQDQIASELGFWMFEEFDINVRAEELEAWLKYREQRKTTLVLLDELSQNLDFRILGIPIGKDYRGVKVLFASRNQEVCYKMNAQKTFEVKALSKKEAWYLFKKTVGIPDDANADLKQMAKDIANKCEGLPLAIIAIAKALRGKTKKAWNDILNQMAEANLRANTGQRDLVYSKIELSYNSMENDEAKLILLLGCLFPEDNLIPIEHLVRFGMALQMFKNTWSLSEVRDRVDSIIDYLKECHLLLASGEFKCVKLHHVIRDVCLSVVPREERVMKVTDVSLKEQQQLDLFKTCTAISMRIQEIVQLPSVLECPKLKLLWLLCQSTSLSIPGDFFERMKKLRVLNINNTENGLPSSLQLLSSLQALCLDFCTLSIDIALIGKLKMLEILSFYCACVHEIPREISDLRNLKQLDFRFRISPKLIPAGILLSFKKLEELYMGDYFQREEKVDELDQQLVIEILSLSHLTTLQISMNEANLLLQLLRGLRLENLERFHIIRKGGQSRQKYQFSRSLELLDVDKSFLLNPVIVMLLKRTENLILGSKGLKSVVNELDEDGFSNLKRLALKSGDYEHLIDATDMVPRKAFTNLESLELYGLKNLKEMCKGNLPVKSFSRLIEVELNGLDSMTYLWRGLIEPQSLCNIRVLKMQSCQAIRNLFQESTLKCLAQLQELDLANCRKLEEVVSREESNRDGKMVQLSKLKVVKLNSLSNIKSFYSQSDIPLQAFFNQVLLPRMEVVQINEISGSKLMIGGQMPAKSLHKLRVIKVHHCRKLEKFATSDSIKLLQKLEQLEVVKCEDLKVLFDFEGLKFSREDAKEVLCHLKKLRLGHNGIAYIWRMVPKEINQAFRNLKYLEVFHCLNLCHFLSPSIANMLVSLEYLEVRMTKLKEIIGEEEEGSLRDETTAAAYKIVLPKLSCIIVGLALNLEMFSLKNYELMFPLLTQLHISGCPSLRKFTAGKLNAPLLKKIHTSPDQVVPVDLKDREDLLVLSISLDDFTTL